MTWLGRPASSLGPGASCCFHGNMDSRNLSISLPMGLAAHFSSLGTLEIMLFLCYLHLGELFLYCSLSVFSDLTLEFLSFSAVLSVAKGRDLSPYLGQNHKIVAMLLSSTGFSGSIWRQ